MGQIHRNYGRYKKAIDDLLAAERIAEQYNLEADLLPTIGNIALVHIDQRNYAKAIEYQRNYRKLSDQRKDTLKMISSCSALGDIYGMIDDYASSRKSIEEGLLLCNQMVTAPPQQLQYSRMNLLFNLAALMNSTGKYDSALLILNPIYQQVKAMNLVTAQRYILSNMAESYLHLHQYDAVLHTTDEMAALLKQDSIPDLYKRMYGLQAIAYAKTGKYELAYQSQEKYKQVSDSLLNKESHATVARLQAEFETEKKDAAIDQLNRERKNQRIITGLSVAGVAITLGLLFLAYRSKKLQQKLFSQKEDLLSQEKKLEKITLEKKIINLEQKALRAQMNPHFIFNSLNSVQYFILNKDAAAANKYLNNFARLIRQTLDNSGRPLIPIQDEVKYLSTYLELEQMRSGNLFQFNVETDPELSTEDAGIPGMLLQPFIENAVFHGILPLKKEGGLISIGFKKSSPHGLDCIITDNGIGRKKAAAMSISTHPEFASKGMKITTDRIDTLNKQYNSAISVEITDYNAGNDMPGTKVVIHFPHLLTQNIA